MTYFLYCDRASNSAKAIASALGIKRILRTKPKVRNTQKNIILNWGCTNIPYYNCNIINRPENVQSVVNKLVFLRSAKNFNTPQWTCEKHVAKQWVESGSIVLARSILRGSGGKGITIIRPNNIDELPNVPLYVLYIPKIVEYRIHCVRHGDGGVIFDIQKKVRQPNVEVKCKLIRSHDNGFIFQRNNIDVPNDVKAQAIAAFNASNLHFGAIDVIMGKNPSRAYVLEINTAPGLEGSTIDNYKNALSFLVGK